MQPLLTLRRWAAHLRDRDKVRTFLRFLARRFIDDGLFESAASLAYTTIFALVPLAMVVFGVMSAFPMFDQWRDQLTEYVFSNFVPSAAGAVKQTLLELLANTGTLTVAGASVLIISVLITLYSVEATFNRIWRVPSTRPQLSRFLVYWTVLTLGGLLAAASLAISSWVFALPIFATSEGKALSNLALRMAPMLIELAAITAIYRVVPHRSVRWSHALAGALLATVLLELVKWGLGVYLSTFNSYQKLYGALAALPILLMWIYLCWIAILLGASFASAASSFHYQPASLRLPRGHDMYGLLRLIGRFHHARREGRGLHTNELLSLEPMLTDSLVQDYVCSLNEIGVLCRAEDGQWLLARDLADVRLSELYEQCNLRIPVAEARLPCRDDALGKATIEAIDALRLPLRDLLKRSVADLYPAEDLHG